MNALIGNLVKYSKSGKLEPYLASHFSISNDRLVWTYKLREQLFCEDGTPINAENFVGALHTQLRLYARETTPIDFENLVGYGKFHSGESDHIDGLRFSNNEVIFQFTKPPQDLNEMLRMPYFGYWCPQNLIPDNWKNTRRFVSSSSYKLSSGSSFEKIVVEKRDDWFSVDADSPQKISFFHSNLDTFQERSSLDKAFIIETTLDLDFQDTILKNLPIVHAPPRWLSTFVLSPYNGGPFSDRRFRQFFLNKLRKHQAGSKFNATYFYSSAKSQVLENTTLTNPHRGVRITVGHFGRTKSKHIQELENMLNSIFNEDGIEFDFIGNTSNEDNWNQKMLSNKAFDIRFSSVASGANIRNFIIKMMFCTKLGVCYPDPSGRICNLVSEYDSKPEAIGDEYIREFNQALYDDASVIPLENYGTTWILSDKIDPSSFPPTVETPLYEALRTK